MFDDLGVTTMYFLVPFSTSEGGFIYLICNDFSERGEGYF